MPAVADAIERGRTTFTLWTPDGVIKLPIASHALASTLAATPWFASAELARDTRSLDPLLAAGILGDEDLPQTIIPDDVSSLGGWRFA